MEEGGGNFGCAKYGLILQNSPIINFPLFKFSFSSWEEFEKFLKLYRQLLLTRMNNHKWVGEPKRPSLLLTPGSFLKRIEPALSTFRVHSIGNSEKFGKSSECLLLRPSGNEQRRKKSEGMREKSRTKGFAWEKKAKNPVRKNPSEVVRKYYSKGVSINHTDI